MKTEEIKKAVKDGYGKVARRERSCCDVSSCRGAPDLAQHISKSIGYSEEELKAIPEGAFLFQHWGAYVKVFRWI